MTHLEHLPAHVDAAKSEISQLRQEARRECSVIAAIHALDALEQNVIAQLELMRQELGAQIRTVHEDLISRLALLQEGRPRRSKRR